MVIYVITQCSRFSQKIGEMKMRAIPAKVEVRTIFKDLKRNELKGGFEPGCMLSRLHVVHK